MGTSIQQIRKKLEELLKGKKPVFLFTGDKGSALLVNIVKDMNVRIVFIDTGYHFKEVIDYAKNYGSEITMISNNSATARPENGMVRCCYQRKAEALKDYLDNFNAGCLIVPFTDKEKDLGIEDSYLKGITGTEILRPLAEFSERDIWIEIRNRNVPFSSIYYKGYSIIDCSCCSTRHGRKNLLKNDKQENIEDNTMQKLKALGYM